jgi:predicted DsbA family dithiol-disulfide isomerase
MHDVVDVEMFLDVSCPWCHGALDTNRRVLDEFAADPSLPKLRVHWKFLRLHGELPLPGLTVDEYMATYTSDPVQQQAMRDDVLTYTASVGLTVNYDRYRVVHDPLLAHALLAAARDDAGLDLPDPWHLARAVFDANFVFGVDITDLGELRAAVETAGILLPGRIWSAIADHGYDEVTRRDRAHALEVELDGVPRMRVGGTIVPTWVDPAEVRQRLRDAITAAHAQLARA